MKGFMLRWLYSLKRPLYMALFLAMIGCVAFSVCITFITGQNDPEQTGFDFSAWFSAAFIALILSCMSMVPLLSDHFPGAFGKYIAVMPVPRKKYLSAVFIFYGVVTLISTAFCSLLPIINMIAANSFDFGYLLFGFSFEFCMVYLTVMLLIMLDVTISNIKLKMIVGIVLFVSFSLLTASFGQDNDWLVKLSELLRDGNCYLISVCVLAVSALIAAAIRTASVKLYERREF